MKRLPPLTALEAFVETARLGSVKAAAESLSLSSPALSRRLQALEAFVGRPLFDRRHQAVHLNVDGDRLLAAIGPQMDGLARALEDAVGQGAIDRLRLGVMPLFASHRLIPRLGRLRATHPSLHLDLDTAPHALARLDEGLDAAIALTRQPDPGLYARKLGSNKVFAIVGNALAEGPHAIRSPAQIADHTILVHRDIPDTFNTWREAVGLPDLRPAAVDVFDSGQLILDAAAQGLGVAFMLDMHFEDAADPRLHRLFDIAVESSYSYWFACRRSALARRPVRLFHDWLVEELG